MRVLGVPASMRTSEESTIEKQRILQMGKARYILLFGVLGGGLGNGLGLAVALMVAHLAISLGEAAAICVALTLLGGAFNGMRAWNRLFAAEVPFPPPYPRSE